MTTVSGANPIGCLFSAWFLLGLYAPSSIDANYSILLWAALLCLLAAFVIRLLFRRTGIGGPLSLFNSLLLIAILLAASALSPFPDYRWGALLPYIVLALIYIGNFRDLRADTSLRTALTLANLINLAAGGAVIVGNEFVRHFLVTHYTSFYPELVELMTEAGKPVLTFGSHSIAAFFFYLMFMLNFETFRFCAKPANLVFAVGYILLGIALFSVTGVVLMSVAILQVFVFFAKRNWKALTALTLSLVAGLILFLGHYVSESEEMAGAFFLAEQAATTSQLNGFSGRFSELGTLYTTVKYIKDRPLTPVGIGYRSDLFFGDSGPVEYYLRGSLGLLVCMYGGLFFFLKRNLLLQRHTKHVFLVIVAFELGFSLLTYVRFLYLLPILIIYLNDLHRKSGISNSFAPAFGS